MNVQNLAFENAELLITESEGDERRTAEGYFTKDSKPEPFYRNGRLVDSKHRYFRYEQELIKDLDNHQQSMRSSPAKDKEELKKY